jgi:hypothetical protein
VLLDAAQESREAGERKMELGFQRVFVGGFYPSGFQVGAIRSSWMDLNERATISTQVGEEVSWPRPWTGPGVRGCSLREWATVLSRLVSDRFQ